LFATLLIPSLNQTTSEEQASGVGQKVLIAVFKIRVTHSQNYSAGIRSAFFALWSLEIDMQVEKFCR
jgi:hypothetical protein